MAKGKKAILKTKEWKWMIFPGYFTTFRIVSNDEGDLKLGERDGLAVEKRRGQAYSPKSSSLLSVHSPQESTLPTEEGKGRTRGSKMGKGSQGAPQLTRRASPSLLLAWPNMTLSTLILTRKAWVLKTNFCLFWGQYLLINDGSRPWVEDKMLFHQGPFIPRGSSEGSTEKNHSLSWAEQNWF